MQDSVIKGTGNSRYLKSVANLLTLYPTYEDFAQALIEGTLPIDLNGVNTSGWQTVGTSLTKANLLKDTTAALYGKTSAAVPDEVLATLAPLLNKNGELYMWSKYASAPQIAVGTYADILVHDMVSSSGGIDIRYGASVSVDDFGNPEITDSQTITVTSDTVSSLATILQGKYYKDRKLGICLFGTDCTFSIRSGSSFGILASSVAQVTAIAATLSNYVSSFSQNAHTDDWKTYKYRGKLGAFVSAHAMSYIGTGGTSVELNFPSAPNIVFISTFGGYSTYIICRGMKDIDNNTVYDRFIWSGKKLTILNSFNSTGNKYNVLAFS